MKNVFLPMEHLYSNTYIFLSVISVLSCLGVNLGTDWKLIKKSSNMKFLFGVWNASWNNHSYQFPTKSNNFYMSFVNMNVSFVICGGVWIQFIIKTFIFIGEIVQREHWPAGVSFNISCLWFCQPVCVGQSPVKYAQSEIWFSN